jgi:3-hydroxybutyryl-CoA dehydrogenase
MGVGIAHVFAVDGSDVILVDASRELTDAAHARAIELLRRLEALGCIGGDDRRRGERNLRVGDSLEAVADAELVVEAVVERPEVKLEVYRKIEAAAPGSAVIATNTSSIPIELLSSGLRLPTRFLGVHWFVPPLLVPCVEVIASTTTDPGVVARVVDALARLGKSPVTVGDGPGFVANRIQFAMFREAASIVEDGLATPQQVDEVVSTSFGFRLPFFGPFTIADMAGLDVYADIYDTLERGLGERFQAPPLLSERVARGELGVKAGGGFLRLTEQDAADLIDRRDRAYDALSRLRAAVEEQPRS